MATYQKRGDTWRAIIRSKGFNASKTFPRKQEAVAWATAIESELHAGTVGTVPNKTFGDLLRKYQNEVTPTKTSAAWESRRLDALIKDEIANKRLAALDSGTFAAWRDRRLETVSAASVLRDWGLMSAVCTRAINEWRWLYKHPMRGVELPKEPEHRDRLISQEEIDRICYAADYTTDSKLETTTSRAAAAFLFAIETGMRAGEIVAIKREDLFLDARYLKVRKGKTQAARRDVPLSAEAIRIINQLPKRQTIFDITSAQLDSLFRKCRDKALVEDLHFHDTRHEAITRLSKRLDVLALARAIGHRDLRMLMVYYNQSAEELAKLL